MVRRLLLSVSVAVFLLLAMLMSVPAFAGGGGCYGQGVLEGAGNTVEMSRMCFSPVILRVQPGETVTFVNRDGLDHMVTGAAMAWGDFAQIKAGKSLKNRFMVPGIYPYACKLHYGMTGVIVVGEGTASGTISVANLRAGDVAAAAAPANQPAPGSTPWPAVALATGLLGIAAGYGVARFRGAPKAL
jgi:plastocyanin